MFYGASGAAVSMLLVGWRPEYSLAWTGVSLIVGGLAGLARADWHAITLEALRGALHGAQRALDRGAPHEPSQADEASHDES